VQQKPPDGRTYWSCRKLATVSSYQHIPLSIRAIVNREFEEFVHANIRSGNSFALETTLRSSIRFDQAKLAKENGFRGSNALRCIGNPGTPHRARAAARCPRRAFGQ